MQDGTLWTSRTGFGVGALLGAVLLALACGCQLGRQARPGPVLLISIDTLRADRLNCYGYEGRQVSPALDALAGDSVLFEQHIAASPWTTPSHLSLLTSRDPSSHGVMQPFRELNAGLTGTARLPILPEDIPTLAEVLKRQGWATGALTGGVTVDPRIGFGRGFDVYDTSMFKLRRENVRRLEQWVTARRAQPFFLFWHSFEVHAPYLRGDFLGDVLPSARARRLSRALDRLARRSARSSTVAGQRVLERHDAWRPEVTAALYDGGVATTDRWIGDVLAHLREVGLYDRALIVVTSDHGEQLGERGRGFYDRHGKTLYEEMIRVPLILKLPRQAYAGTRVTSTTRAIDVMPTILDVAGMSREGLGMQGESLRSLWEHPERSQRRLAFSEATSGKDELKSLRSDGHKYILTIDRAFVRANGRAVVPSRPARRQLYALRSDPLEAVDLLNPPRLDEDLRTLAGHLDTELRGRVNAAARKAVVETGTAETLEGLRALGYVE